MATPATPDEGVVVAVGAARSDVVAVALERDGLVVTGSDAVTFVQGQVSADVSSLAVGDSTWSLLLEPQGKVAASPQNQDLSSLLFLIWRRAAEIRRSAGHGGVSSPFALGHTDVSTTMIYTHVVGRAGSGTISPMDRLLE